MKVIYRWLGPFLRVWEAGATVLKATKMDNGAVGRALGDAPQYALAVIVFGDLLLTKGEGRHSAAEEVLVIGRRRSCLAL